MPSAPARRRAEQRRRAAEEAAPAAEPAPDWTQRLTALGTFGPPTTLVAGVLIWYGYVATLQRFRYFGVDLKLTGLSNQDLLLYGLEVAYPAATLLLLITLGALGAHLLIRGIVLPTRPGLARGIALALALAGAALAVRALAGVFWPRVAENETPGITPLSLTACAPLLVYAFWLARQAGDGGWRDRPVMGEVQRGGRLVAIALAVVGLFWAANSLAGEVGVARAYDDARNFQKLPEVVLYTKEPLTDAPHQEDFGEKVAFRYRYRNLRLLTASGGRLFLVPLTWRPTDTTARVSTFVIPYDGSVRLQLLPQSRG
ncbi:hypothetical protein DPM19_04090 [Actinomadura craniellae]|uniref:Uncharacterized protein n=1 Tax=Actinomadura craniellae TaxID=2231787 RepID=A0A365HAE3_9ACTN|nr:hypothetical protein [Actinomadura craniellae]RAY16114.1 hypothetical protein DPM19_04090 [Actinomadura craniellae]